jgi:DNA methylase
LTRKAKAMPAGGGGGAWAKKNEEMAANRAKRQAMGNLTFVKDNRSAVDLDPGSQQILEVAATGTSIFDPVLCELAYRWFCPPGGLVLDPFAGGSVRGIVASKCGRRYIGVDLSERQVGANREQAWVICDGGEIPVWVCGDAANLAAGVDCAADFVFSCPPYGDLEVYSDNPADLSTMAPEAFMAAYWQIIAAAIGKLKKDRFACFVVGDYRDKQGFYRNFPGETVAAFAAAGAGLYPAPGSITRRFS